MLDSKHTVSIAQLSAAREDSKRELSLDFGKKQYPPADLESLLEALCSIRTLNDLSIQRLPCCQLREGFYSLTCLLRLSLTAGELAAVSPAIGHMQHLKYLDLSQNKLQSLPSEIYSLLNLTSLNISSNQLTSLPDAPNHELLPALSAINLGHNLIQHFPIPLLYMSSLSEIDIPANSLLEIPPAIHFLQQLRRIDARENKIAGLPNELSRCKLKSLSFESNPIKDRKLKKLIEQHGATKPKSVLDYLKANVPECRDEPLPKPQAVLLKELSRASKHSAHIKQTADWIIELSEAAREYRPFYFCCLLRSIDLSRKLALSQFLKLQADIHASEHSKNRQLCTLGTHDLSAVSFPLKLCMNSSLNVLLQPLGCGELVTAFDFLKQVERESLSKQGDYAYLNRYISLLKSTEYICYLEDSKATVLSLPPITNCQASKLQERESDVFIEVSSDRSADACRRAMELLLSGMLQAGISSCGACTEGATPLSAQTGHLEIEQVRAVNASGGLVGVYPSRSDLVDWNVKWS